MNKQDVKPRIEPNSKKLPFVEYCDGLKNEQKAPNEVHTPLDKFFIAIAKVTGKHPGSIRRWYYGTSKPGKLEKQAVADLVNSKVEILWPAES